jgi:hypothetical protein
LQNQELINQTGYAMEYMHKAIRMADRDVDGACTGLAQQNYDVSVASRIRFLGYDYSASDYRCMEFSIGTGGDIGKIMVKKSGDKTFGGLASVTAMELTSGKITISTLDFEVVGDTVNAGQPKITIFIDAVSASKRVNPIPRVTLQTTASQRNLNISQ